MALTVVPWCFFRDIRRSRRYAATRFANEPIRDSRTLATPAKRTARLSLRSSRPAHIRLSVGSLRSPRPSNSLVSKQLIVRQCVPQIGIRIYRLACLVRCGTLPFYSGEPLPRFARRPGIAGSSLCDAGRHCAVLVSATSLFERCSGRAPIVHTRCKPIRGVLSSDSSIGNGLADSTILVKRSSRSTAPFKRA